MSNNIRITKSGSVYKKVEALPVNKKGDGFIEYIGPDKTLYRVVPAKWLSPKRVSAH
jgi:hypothetical protein